MIKKDIYLDLALREIPRLLGLIDKNPLSKTYGCFDRNYWHYKTVDFPTGMAQLGVLPLAYVYLNDFKNNSFYQQSRIKELILAGLRYMPECSHKDGTTDEFYPFERALGATAFSLIAATEAYLLLNEHHKDIVDFFKKRADWMIDNTEPCVIANHQAGAALALVNVWLITKDEKYLKGAKEKIKDTLAWFCHEGWFKEYEGCDPGYLTFTIDYLAKYYKKTKDASVLSYLDKAVDFCSYFIHPDGSFGGEYGSRNTGHFYPCGFEILGKHNVLALQIVNKYAEGLVSGKNEFMNDEKYFFYNLINYFQTYLEWNDKQPEAFEHKVDFEKYFPEAKIYVCKNTDYYVICSLAKGGVVKVFKKNKLVFQDTGIVGEIDDGRIVASSIIDDSYKINVEKKHLVVKGVFNSVNRQLPSPFKMIIFRVLLLCFAWNWKLGSLVKDLLVKKLITYKKRVNISFVREVFIGDNVKLNTSIELFDNVKFLRLYGSTDAQLIQVPTSKYFQESSLLSWRDYSKKLSELNVNKKLVISEVI